jgi:hypothetical protein
VSERPTLDHLVAVPTRPPGAPARDLPGHELSGAPRIVEVARPGHWTLLLFLGSACEGCAPFWPAAQDPAVLGLRPGDEVVALVRETEDPSRIRGELARLGAIGTPLLVSDAAWRAYGVHGPPFFALVDGREVATEGVAWSVEQVAADVRRARVG